MADAVVKLALVVGSAACVWDDVRAARALCKFDAVCCVKRVGIYWPEPFDVWATLHPEYQKDFEARRRAEGYPDGHIVVAPPDAELGEHGRAGAKYATRRVPYRWGGLGASAGSGIYGAKVMTGMGYRCVLAGIPMNDSPHFVPHEKWKDGAWSDVGRFTQGLEQSKRHLMGRVKSMSGRTREMFGYPTAEWLAESQA